MTTANSSEDRDGDDRNEAGGGNSNSPFLTRSLAIADNFSSAQTGLTEDFLKIAKLDVLANDLGGRESALWSVDNGVNNSGALAGAVAGDLLKRDVVRAESVSTDTSLNGAKIWITTDGKVGYDATTLSAGFKAQLQSLGAGQDLTDTFTYAIRVDDSKLSWATATVHFQGVNDVATVSSDTKFVTETDSGASLNASGQLAIADIDAGQNHVIAQTNFHGTYGDFSVDANGAWTYVANGAHNELVAGEKVSETFTVTSQDSSATGTVKITITGSDDIASVSSQTQSVTEGDSAAALNTSGQLTISDADAGQAHVVAQTNFHGTYGDFSIDANGAWTYVGNDAHNELAANQEVSDSFTVHSQDGSTSGIVTVLIHGTAELTGGGGGGTGGDPFVPQTFHISLTNDSVAQATGYGTTLGEYFAGSVQVYNQGLYGNPPVTQAEIDAMNDAWLVYSSGETGDGDSLYGDGPNWIEAFNFSTPPSFDVHVQSFDGSAWVDVAGSGATYTPQTTTTGGWDYSSTSPLLFQANLSYTSTVNAFANDFAYTTVQADQGHHLRVEVDLHTPEPDHTTATHVGYIDLV